MPVGLDKKTKHLTPKLHIIFDDEKQTYHYYPDCGDPTLCNCPTASSQLIEIIDNMYPGDHVVVGVNRMICDIVQKHSLTSDDTDILRKLWACHIGCDR